MEDELSLSKKQTQQIIQLLSKRSANLTTSKGKPSGLETINEQTEKNLPAFLQKTNTTITSLSGKMVKGKRMNTKKSILSMLLQWKI